MKTIRIFIFILITLGIFSCGKKYDTPPKTYFDAPFPKKSIKDLSWILGEKVTINTYYGDTIVLNISFKDNVNSIFDETNGYQMFNGAVCKYKGKYILSEEIQSDIFSDKVYMIYMIKLKGNLIYGLSELYQQRYYYDNAVEKGLFDKMVLYKDSTSYLLHPDKKILGNHFKMLMDSNYFAADTIISKINLKAAEQIDKEDVESNEIQTPPSTKAFSYKVYPNPVKDVLNADVVGGNKINYQLLDLKGQALLKGVLNEGATRINVGSLPVGVYVLSFINPETKKPEQVKIIKK